MQYRRGSDLKSRYQEHRVSEDPLVNGKLEQPMRLSNVEHDIVLNTSIMSEVVAQNDKYAKYLDALIDRELDAKEFWGDVRKKVVTTGVLGTIGLVFTVAWFAIKEYIRHL